MRVVKSRWCKRCKQYVGAVKGKQVPLRRMVACLDVGNRGNMGRLALSAMWEEGLINADDTSHGDNRRRIWIDYN